MRRLLLTLAIVASSCFAVAAQSEATRSDPRPFDQFGDILISDWLARADNFVIELQNNPSARGYIVAYGVPNKLPGWPSRRAHQVMGYLVKARGIDPFRLEVVYGGYRDEVWYQLWVVGSGMEVPVRPFDFTLALSREKTPFLFDRFFWFPLNENDIGIESGYIGYLDERGRYEAFAEALRSDLGSRGCVIAYAGRGNRRGTDRRLAARVKMMVVTANGLGADRVAALAGGTRRQQTVELWLVPPGSALPKPTPDARPARRQRRR